MNIFSGHISDIQVNESLSLVSIKINEQAILQVIVVETPQTAPYLIKKNPIQVLFKETEVIITKEDIPDISIENKIKGTVNTIEKGILLSTLSMDSEIGTIVAILSTEALQKLNLEKGSVVIAMIKINEIMLAE